MDRMMQSFHIQLLLVCCKLIVRGRVIPSQITQKQTILNPTLSEINEIGICVGFGPKPEQELLGSLQFICCNKNFVSNSCS